MRRAHVLGAAVLAVVLPGGDASAVERKTERLSNERTLTRVAHPYVAATIRKKPSGRSGKLDKLHYRTEDGPLEVYLLLRSTTDRQGREWIELRIPGRPNGRTGWVPRDALGPFRIVRTQLVVERNRLRATLYRSGKRIWTSHIGVGKPSTPTPTGHFWIRERLQALGGPYGPWAFGTAAYSVLSEWPGGGVIGIHGTNQPALLPGRVSHGCIRVPNGKISRLARIMPVGTPLRIR